MYLFILGCAGSSLLCGLFSSYAEEGLLFCYGAQVLGYTGFHSCGFWALEHRFSSCGTWAWLLHGMWIRLWNTLWEILQSPFVLQSQSSSGCWGSVNKHLLKTYYMSETVLSARVTVKDTSPFFKELMVLKNHIFQPTLIRIALSNTLATGHLWLFTFKLIK